MCVLCALCAACSWCREPIFTSWLYELATKAAVLIRQLVLIYLPHPM